MPPDAPAERGPWLSRLPGVQIAATGSYVPEQVVTNEDLRARQGFDPAWIVQRTGILERRIAAADEATSHLAERAGRACLARAGVAPEDVDLLIVATFTPDMSLPSTACLVQDRLGMLGPAFVLSAACSGFVYALATGMQFVATGTCRRVLVIGADCNTRMLDPADGKTFPLFGDGAGAALLTPGDAEQGFLSYTLGSDGSGGGLLYRPACGSLRPPSVEDLDQGLHYVKMDGRAVFKWAIRIVEQTVADVLRHAGLTIDELDYVVLHQANVRIIDAAADCLGIADRSKVVVNLDRYGNTSAASIPLALDELARAGRLRRGSRVLVSGFGAGLAWGTGVLSW